MRLIEVTLRPPRVYVLGHRVHHGLIGLLLLLSDAGDARRWVPDLLAHPSWRTRRA